MNPLTSIPPTVRAVLYYLFAVGSVVVTYCAAKGYLGVEEVSLWAGIAAVFGFTAGANTPTGSRNDRGAVDVGTAVLVGILVLLVLVVLGVLR